jgi:nitroreductase
VKIKDVNFATSNYVLNSDIMNEVKIAVTRYPVIELIKKRWSARSFSAKEIAKNDLMTILEAGSWAFSSMNAQPWRVLVARRGEEDFQRILDCLLPGNTPWAQHAAAFIVSICRTTLERDGSLNAAAEHDLGAFNATLVLQARSMDIFCHPMGGINPKKLKEEFNLGDEFKPLVVIAVGYQDEPGKLEEPFLTREITPRARKAPEEFILNL